MFFTRVFHSFFFFFLRKVLISGEAYLHGTNRLFADLDLDCFIFSPKSPNEGSHFHEGLGIREEKAISHYIKHS